MPYVLIEALAAGLPIVATQSGGVAMTVQHGINGLIAPVDDSASLAAALVRLATDDALRAQFAAASASRAEEFTARKMVERTIAVYEQVVAAWPGRSQANGSR
jgi:glycosyltransferase involved in cell wall biosynthesis